MDFDMQPYVRYIAKAGYYLKQKIVANDCRMLYIISGNGTFESGDKIYRLSAGTLLCYPYGVAYRVTGEESGLLFYTVNFDFDFKNTNITTMMPKEEHNHKKSEEIHSISEEWQAAFLKVNYLQNAFWAEEIFETIYNEAVNKKEGYNQLQSAVMKQLLIRIYRDTNNDAKQNLLCRQIKELVLKNLKLNNKEIAKILNYHPFYLNQVMQKSEGLSLHKYIVKQRLKKACELITTTGEPLDVIAVGCGFSSQAHLSTAFRAEYNVPPSVLRKQI